MDLTFFNPHSQSEADFLASFVARGEMLDYFLRQLRLLSGSEPARHHLIVAPRGYGKTSLLRRLAIAVRIEPDLAAKYIPLTFREEQHNVISLDVFWRNCLQSLAEAREDEQAPVEEIRELDATWTKHVPRQAFSRDEQDGEPAWREFSAHCLRLGRRPLLLIDNLDSLLAGLPGKQQWSLRATLQQESGPVLIAAAPQFPGSVHDRSAAFYDFFRIETLDKLSDLEVTRCLRTMAWRRGKPGKVVLDLLDTDPGRIAALNTLAGGNPRTLSVLYSVLESHMSADLLSQLSTMLDTFTSWYQSRTEDLPYQARAVFDALALNWNPMKAAAVGAVTGLDTTTVSSQISRLEKAGLVEAVALNRRGTGRNGYQLSERFFNIWYLMRNGPRRTRQSIKFLAVFLQSCFSAAERRSLAGRVMTTGAANPAYALGLAASLPASALRDRLLDYAETQSSLAGEQEEYGASIEEMRRATRPRQKQHNAPEQEQKLAELDRTIRRLERTANHTLNVKLAEALVKKGDTLRQLGRFTEAVALYDSIFTRYADAPNRSLREQVAEALVKKGVTLGQLSRIEEALDTYDNVVMHFGETSDLGLGEHVARALVNKGLTLRQLARAEEAVETYDSVVTRFGDASELGVREHVANALVNKGLTLGPLGRSREAIDTYDSVVTRFGDASELPLRTQVAKALVNKSVEFNLLGRFEEAIDTSESVVTLFGNASELVLREGIARALVNKGTMLSQLGRSETAIETYDSVVRRFGEASEPALREQVAKALVSKGVTLGQLGRPEEEVDIYNSILTRFGDDAQPVLKEPVARALLNKAITLGQLGRFEQEMDAYDSVVRRFGDAPEADIREHVAQALVNKGVTLALLGRHSHAIESFNSVVARFGDASEPVLREQVTIALVNMGTSYTEIGQPQRAAPVLRSAATAAISKWSGMAWNNLGCVLLDLLGEPAGAIAAFESGLAADVDSETRAFLHANRAYASILHRREYDRARDDLLQALADENSISLPGRHLLGALTHLQDSSVTRWVDVFEQIGIAVESGDADLWSDYLVDLQRLLWFIIAQGEGRSFHRWMEQKEYPLRYAPLYYAVLAAIEDEDLLLQINPETRETAIRIHQGIARMVTLYGRQHRTDRTSAR